MSSLGFLNHCSSQPDATWVVCDSIREHHPDAPFFFSIDGSDHYGKYNLAVNYDDNKTEWLFNKETLGYPPYNRQQVLEWLKRTYIGVLKLNTKYVCNIEDDCLILDKLTIDPKWEIAGHTITVGNKIHKSILHEIESFNGRQLSTDHYGAGGGTIFKSSTFIRNYPKVIDYIDRKWDFYLDLYSPPAGFMDCFLVIYFMLCGCEFSHNPNILNVWPEDRTSTIEQLKEQYGGQYQLIHNWKKYYR